MRKIYTILFLAFTFQAMACDVLTGSLTIEQFPNNVVKIYVAGTVANECFPTDSASLRVKFTCGNGQFTKEEIGLTDTLIYEISGETSIGFSVIWWNRGGQVGRTDVEPRTHGTGNGLCFKRIQVVEASEVEPEISTENPPPTYEITFHGNLVDVSTPWAGQVRIFDQSGVMVKFHEFGEGVISFDCEFSGPALFYVNVLLFRPASKGGLISETFTMFK